MTKGTTLKGTRMQMVEGSKTKGTTLKGTRVQMVEDKASSTTTVPVPLAGKGENKNGKRSEKDE